MKTVFSIFSLIFALSSVSALALTEKQAPESSVEGLELVEKDDKGEIYADPGIDWSEYSKIRLDTATVAFRKNWQRDQNRRQRFKVKDQDVEQIKSEMSELFDQVFAEEMVANGGFDITAENGSNVMRIEPKIVDLEIYAPDTPSSSRESLYSKQAGKMTLKLEIYDTVSGALIAKTSDHQETPLHVWEQRMTATSNRAEAERIIRKWAVDLRDRLVDARSASENSENGGNSQ